MSVFKIKITKDGMIAYGTCFLLKNNYLLTACHVLWEKCEIYIFYKETLIKCYCVHHDKRLDIAILNSEIIIEEPYFEFEYIVNNAEVYSMYFLEESCTQKQTTGNILIKNSVSAMNVDSTVVDYYIGHGASGCPIINKSTNKVIGILTWANKHHSGGCVLRLIKQFVDFVSEKHIMRYGLDIFTSYKDTGGIVINSKSEIDCGKIIIKVNGNHVGLNYVSIESLVYYSHSLYCHVTFSDNLTEVYELKTYEQCNYCYDKPMLNVTILDDMLC
tara:strand:- start:338 stop:1156 length:819 start_codon:yes stop_codon:yes gene_type:complete